MTPSIPRTLALALALGVPALASAHGGYGYRYSQPSGVILVDNQSGGALDLTLGSRVQHVAPGERATFWAHAGDRTVTATYVLFGAVRPLAVKSVSVQPGRTAYVSFEPSRTAPVMVENTSHQLLDVYANGALVGEVGALSSGLVTMPVGCDQVRVQAGGRDVLNARVDVAPFAEKRVAVRFLETGRVTVSNPWPVAMDLTGAGVARRINPGETIAVDLPLGMVNLVATTRDGSVIDRDLATVTWGMDAAWRISAPTTAAMSLDSGLGLPTQVLVDGAVLASLQPFQHAMVRVSTGWHHVTATDDHGRLVEDSWVEARPFEVALAELNDGPRHDGREWHGEGGHGDWHDPDHDGDEHRGDEHARWDDHGDGGTSDDRTYGEARRAY